jgi:hypothetical protein
MYHFLNLFQSWVPYLTVVVLVLAGSARSGARDGSCPTFGGAATYPRRATVKLVSRESEVSIFHLKVD